MAQADDRAPYGGNACRHCKAALTVELADLGASPIANDYIDPSTWRGAEPFYSLRVLVCSACRLAQTVDVLDHDAIFRSDYAYFSSHSTTWLQHARTYVHDMIGRFGLGHESQVIEIASNDGYLLQYVRDAGVPCFGIEPCESVALAAQNIGIETHIEYFTAGLARRLAEKELCADLIVANNVLAHVPDINDFTAGLSKLLKPQGVATIEVQHLLRLMQRNQFDTIYHEHFSYLSLLAASHIFAAAGLRLFDVEELPTHGGSIRFFLCRADAEHATTENVARVRAEEIAHGLDQDAAYLSWAEGVRSTKRALLEVLIRIKNEGRSIAAYGAPAKGVTLLNYCGVGRDFIDFTVDRAPSKQNRWLPGVHIPILAPDAVFERKPDFLLILPWNLKDEIEDQMAAIREWGAKFIVPIPFPTIE